MGDKRRDNDIIIFVPRDCRSTKRSYICISYPRAFPLGGDRSRIFFQEFKTTQNKCPSKIGSDGAVNCAPTSKLERAYYNIIYFPTSNRILSAMEK